MRAWLYTYNYTGSRRPINYFHLQMLIRLQLCSHYDQICAIKLARKQIIRISAQLNYQLIPLRVRLVSSNHGNKMSLNPEVQSRFSRCTSDRMLIEGPLEGLLAPWRCMLSELGYSQWPQFVMIELDGWLAIREYVLLRIM